MRFTILTIMMLLCAACSKEIDLSVTEENGFARVHFWEKASTSAQKPVRIRCLQLLTLYRYPNELVWSAERTNGAPCWSGTSVLLSGPLPGYQSAGANHKLALGEYSLYVGSSQGSGELRFVVMNYGGRTTVELR
jgi:hypothetical protein